MYRPAPCQRGEGQEEKKSVHLRPNERDLKKAEIFMEETIEENFDWKLA